MTPQKKHCLQKKIVGKSILLISIAVIAIFAITGCSEKEEPVKKEVIRPAKIMIIEQQETAENSKFPGKVQALDRVEISFEVSGKLVELAIKEGQRVKKGDLVARIDPSDYKNNLAAQQAKVNQAKAEVDRYVNLLKEKVVAKSTYDVKKRNYEVAVSGLNIARKAFNDTRLKASFDGIIGKRFVDNYQIIQAKQPIVSLQRLSAIEIVVNAPENIMRENSEDLSVKFKAAFANYPDDIFSLAVKEYAVEADSQTQTYRVVFTMPTPEGKTILDGMTATVFVEMVSAAVDAVEVPVQSIFYDEDDKAYVWKTSPDLHVNRHPVEVGTLTNGGNIKITSGLVSGDRIITAGVQKLTEGLKVREFTGTMGE
ncbi:MAG: efflux RND transporter periplasmic adaptor subunit [Thermodesulfobacteriota bacterium]|nr:efflux RND transporter periplasmic adaptor subunit [Thermodesulfobacteriota bacterium]